jgi:transposase-like protein
MAVYRLFDGRRSDSETLQPGKPILYARTLKMQGKMGPRGRGLASGATLNLVPSRAAGAGDPVCDRRRQRACKAIGDVFGERSPVQRCQRHKERNVLDHLPDSEQGRARARLRVAWSLAGHEEALGALAAELNAPTPTPLARCERAWRRR